MDFVWGLLKVVVGAFVLFTVARILYGRLLPKAGWVWVILVAALTLANMFVHRWIGSTINPPFYTAVLFAMTLFGMAPDDTVVEGQASQGSRWFKRGAIAVAIGTAIGWLAFASVSHV